MSYRGGGAIDHNQAPGSEGKPKFKSLQRSQGGSLRRAWAPLTFSDDELPVRADPVSPAKRSQGAYRKASRRRTADGRPTESFDTLLEELATLTRSEVRVAGQSAGPTFAKLSLPTDLQRRAFELLQAPIPAKLT